MTRSIDRDLSRFKNIVRGRVRKNLKKYITHGEMMGRQGKRTVSIPVPNIEIPHFQHGQRGSGGVGQGDGEVGQPIGRGQDDGDGTGQAGSDPGSGHYREVELTLEELAEMLADELELPNIVPKGQDALESKKDRYTTIRQRGPESLRHFKRTYKQALKRSIASNTYDPQRPLIVPTRDDQLYRSWKTVNEPKANAAIIYMMDVSGSMTTDQKDIVRTEAFWIDTWLKSQYDGVQIRYVIHDAVAKEVDEDAFYHTHESGGTRISSAYEVARKIVEREFSPDEWNIYCFQFSDGDNWGEDNKDCLEILLEKLLPHCNLFCYGQVDSPYGSGDFIRELRRINDEWENLVLSEIDTKDDIYESIKTFLGKGA
jgi:sporulation protein YhbH